MKNAQSKLSQTLSQHYITRYRLILTGTPLQVSADVQQILALIFIADLGLNSEQSS